MRALLLKIVEKILDDDELRILRVMLADTTLEVKIENAEASPFTSNIGSPQGDSISGPLFTIYLNHALQQIRNKMQEEPIDVRDINLQWIEKTESNIPDMIVYADDCDFITEIDEKKGKIYQLAKDVMIDMNLIVNEDKTKHTTVKGGTKEEESKWRNVIKLESKLGDREDIERRKGLATIALSKNATIWKDKWKIKQKTRI